MFSGLYVRAMRWAQHRHAPWYLGALSFAESSFFPIPPDVMLAPMALARPDRAYRYALLTTITSVLGGVLGYLIGLFLFELVEPLLHDLGYWDAYRQAVVWFAEWGFWAVFLAGFSPIPYKIFTIAAGAMAMVLPLFVLASLIGRGARFMLVAGLMRWGGVRMESLLRSHIERIGWATVFLAIILYLWVNH